MQKDFGHIQAECSSFPSNQRKIYNITNDEKGESNQANNVVNFTTHIRHMKDGIHIGEPSNSKKICVTHYHKIVYIMLGNMSQYFVTHDYQCINFVFSIPLYCYKLYGR